MIFLPKRVTRELLGEMLKIHMDTVCRHLLDDGTLHADTFLVHAISVTRRVLNLPEHDVEWIEEEVKKYDDWSLETYLDFIFNNVVVEDKDGYPSRDRDVCFAPSQN